MHSLTTGLDLEIQELVNVLEHLKELFPGIQILQVRQDDPLNVQIEQVKTAHLYVALLNSESEVNNHIRFFENAQPIYEVVVSRGIPRLVYQIVYNEQTHSPPSYHHPRSNYSLLQTIYAQDRPSFVTKGYAVRNLFAHDFTRLLRTPLFDKVKAQKADRLSLKALHVLSLGWIQAQVETVSQGKYLPTVYTQRATEDGIKTFVDSAAHYVRNCERIINELTQIAANYNLWTALDFQLPKAGTALLNSVDVDQHFQAIEQLKESFYFSEVEALRRQIDETLRHYDLPDYSHRYQEVIASLKELPFVHIEQLDNLLAIFTEVAARSRALGRAYSADEPILQELFRHFPSEQASNNTLQLANDLLKELVSQVSIQSKRCVALVSGAGLGKTNLICHFAETLVQDHAVILLSGQMVTTATRDFEDFVQHEIESSFRSIFTDWLNRLEMPTFSDGPWLYILVDAVNESHNLRLFIQYIRTFLPRLRDRKVRLILSCRDIYWDSLTAAVTPYLYNRQPYFLDEFSADEWKQAVHNYFQLFRINAELGASARKALRNPLLLRFFSEVNKDCSLGNVGAIVLNNVFEQLLNFLESRVMEQFPLRETDTIVDFLMEIALQMWVQRTSELTPDDLSLTRQDFERPDSTYNLIRAENLILVERENSTIGQKTVRFLYDEFMEYMLARGWLVQLKTARNEAEARQRLLQEVTTNLYSFPSALKAIYFLDEISGGRGRLIKDIIILVASEQFEFMVTNQIAILDAFQHLGDRLVDEELIRILLIFEELSRDEVREQLEDVMIDVLKRLPDHPLARQIAGKILELETQEESAISDSDSALRSVSASKQSNTDSKGIWDNAHRLFGISDLDQFVNRTADNVESDETLEEEKPRLPPMRYHYRLETRLNAISILAASSGSHDEAVIEEGIRSLGRMELHSSLQALASLDLAADDLIYYLIDKYMKVQLAEYRIYCAWLLRQRYGPRSASYLLQLLLDENTRVHRYTFGLFEVRYVEVELVEAILGRLGEDKDIADWHLLHLLELMGLRSRFTLENRTLDLHGEAMISKLKEFTNHHKASLRLAAYHSMLAYPELIERNALLIAMRHDSDPYVREMSEQPSAT